MTHRQRASLLTRELAFVGTWPSGSSALPSVSPRRVRRSRPLCVAAVAIVALAAGLRTRFKTPLQARGLAPGRGFERHS
jgi:hypothetical protein